jgi:hypothetical protein
VDVADRVRAESTLAVDPALLQQPCVEPVQMLGPQTGKADTTERGQSVMAKVRFMRRRSRGLHPVLQQRPALRLRHELRTRRAISGAASYPDPGRCRERHTSPFPYPVSSSSGASPHAPSQRRSRHLLPKPPPAPRTAQTLESVLVRVHGHLISYFWTGKRHEFVGRIIVMGLVAVGASGLFLHGMVGDPQAISTASGRRPVGIGEALGVLSPVAGMSALFVAIQFRYLFGSSTVLEEAGLTVASYARRGCGELIAVALLTILLLVDLARSTRRDEVGHRRWFVGAAATVAGLVIVALVSAWYRLDLYIGAFGASRVRTYASLSMPMSPKATSLVWLMVLLSMSVTCRGCRLMRTRHSLVRRRRGQFRFAPTWNARSHV